MPIYSYSCPGCNHVTDSYLPRIPQTVPVSVACEKCGQSATRDMHAEVVQRFAEPPGFASDAGGVCPADVERANREYADLGVKFDANGTAHVPAGRGVYEKFLHRRYPTEYMMNMTRRRRLSDHMQIARR